MKQLVTTFTWCFVLIFFSSEKSFAESIISIDNKSVVVCPSNSNLTEFPTFNEKNCKVQSLSTIDPQNKAIWLKATLPVSESYLQRQQPSGLFVFAKMSSEVFFNGERLGNNGTPHVVSSKEFFGKMDVRFYVPPKLIRQGDNEIIIHASSHHGFLSLTSPIHFIGLAEYADPQSFFQRDLWISLSLLGALLLGCIALSTIAFQSENKKSTILLLLMAFLASGQLFVEISRSLFSYSYPFQDLRLIIITFLACGFGVSFLAFSLEKYNCANTKPWFLITLLLTIIAIFLIPGFDGKTALAILVPALASSIFISAKYFKERDKKLFAVVCTYALFSLTIVLTFYSFHSSYFYYLVTVMMAVLVVNKANELVKEKLLRKEESEELLKLQLKLDQIHQQHTPTKLKLSSAGKTEFILTQDVDYCKAAGDYVEIFLVNKQVSLFSGTLKAIEEQLPSTFIKVHRSFVVNLEQVVSITSNKQGSNSGGSLMLQTGAEIPVSRRILPKIREVVNDNA
ncbi:LytR/AlgR family response regulator transcription factor [Colwelliaceae bacterium BS250]